MYLLFAYISFLTVILRIAYCSQSFHPTNESGTNAYIDISMYCNARTTDFMSGTDKAFVMTVIETGLLQTVITQRQPDDKHCKKFK